MRFGDEDTSRWPIVRRCDGDGDGDGDRSKRVSGVSSNSMFQISDEDGLG